MTWDVIVIGGGAAGLLAAGSAAEAGAKTLLLEKNDKVGRKIVITGKGRCNVTNAAEPKAFMENIVTNPRFLYSALSRFGSEELRKLIEDHGTKLKVERGERVFPGSDRSFDIVDALLKYVKGSGAQIHTGEAMISLNVRGDGSFAVKTNREERVAKSVVIATGGLSYPTTGSTGDGHKVLEGLGLDVTDLRPSLIPFTVREAWCSELMGLSLRNIAVSITGQGKSKPLFEDFGEMLFTHFGVSGPVILSGASRMQAWLRKKKLTYQEADLVLHIDLKPALSAEELDKRLQKDLETYAVKDYRNALDELLPRKLIPVFVRLSMIDPVKKAGDLTKEERQRIGRLLKDFTLHLTGTRPIEEAIVSMGGVSVKEMDPSTMMVKMIPGLFVAGELLDVDALTGGFNLQIAFSTGRAAGIGAAEYAVGVSE